MAKLIFSRGENRIRLMSGAGKKVGEWIAYNNAQTSSAGPFPNGTYPLHHFSTHNDDGVNSSFGSYGSAIFDKVPDSSAGWRSDMGVHSGRRDIADGLGRKGPAHATNGCVRTIDDAMKVITTLPPGDKLTGLTVQDEPLSSRRLASKGKAVKSKIKARSRVKKELQAPRSKRRKATARKKM